MSRMLSRLNRELALVHIRRAVMSAVRSPLAFDAKNRILNTDRTLVGCDVKEKLRSPGCILCASIN
jgi:hypothetical protein